MNNIILILNLWASEHQTTSKFLFSLSAINSASSTFESVLQLMTQYSPYYSRRSSDFPVYNRRVYRTQRRIYVPTHASAFRFFIEPTSFSPCDTRLLFNFHDLIIFSFLRRAYFTAVHTLPLVLTNSILPNFTFFFLLQRRAQPEQTTMKNYRYFTLL